MIRARRDQKPFTYIDLENEGSNRVHFIHAAAIVKTLRWHDDEDPNRRF